MILCAHGQIIGNVGRVERYVWARRRTFVAALSRRLSARQGKRWAILAVAHSIMVSVFHMLACNEPYRELGANYFDERRQHDTIDRLTARIEH